jgi:hypothetical protein
MQFNSLLAALAVLGASTAFANPIERRAAINVKCTDPAQ